MIQSRVKKKQEERNTFSQMKMLCMLQGRAVTLFTYGGQGGNSLFCPETT